MAKRQNETNLLASIAVFAEMCDTETDIQSIINEFIKSVYAFEKSWALNSKDVEQLLKKHFDFDIPEAVVKYCLNSLKNKNFLEKKEGQFVLVDNSYSAEDFSQKLNLKKEEQSSIESKLIDYYSSFCKGKPNEGAKNELIENFISYLLDNGVSDNYSTIISSFVLENSQSPAFVKSLNQIKEGLISITGLKYTNDLTHLGKWNDELYIYLDTEILFNAAGYNGVVYQKLWDDFYGLINEINQSSIKKNQKKLIHLKYFADTKSEIDQFFSVAEKIIRREDNATPGNAAMIEICKGCSTVNEIIRKKSFFETNLKTLGISQQDEVDYYSKPEYNVESSELLDKYKDKFDEDVLVGVLHSFTKINFFRKGNNRTSFEKCKHIFLSGKTASMRLSKDLEIKNEAKDIPFSTDIYFITNRLWFKLNKGLSKNGKLPSTLDIVTKAQVVLSSQINKSVDKNFQGLKNDIKSGNLTKEQAQDYYHNLREKAKKPEEINVQNVQDSIEIIFDDSYEAYLREKSVTQIKLEEGDAAKQELKRMKLEKQIAKKRPLKRKYKVIYGILATLFFIVIIAYLSGSILLISKCINQSDTLFSKISGFFTIIPVLLGIIKIKWIKILNYSTKNKLKLNYIKELPNKLKRK